MQFLRQAPCDHRLEAQRAFDEFPHDRLFLWDALSRADGNLFVDRWPNPTAWFLRNALRHTSFITGECSADGFLHDVAACLRTDQWGPCLSVPSDYWRQQFAERFAELFYVGEPMITFKNPDLESFNATAVPQEGFSVQRLEICHVEQIRPKGWPDPADFVNKSIGFGVVNDRGVVVSYAISNFPTLDAIEVAVQTQPEYQRRGFAWLAASALLDFCLCRKWKPQWTSWAGNTAACALARKLTFREEHPHDWAFVRPQPQS